MKKCYQQINCKRMLISSSGLVQCIKSEVYSCVLSTKDGDKHETSWNMKIDEQTYRIFEF